MRLWRGADVWEGADGERASGSDNGGSVRLGALCELCPCTALGRLYAQRREPLHGNAALVARFDRRQLIERLVSIFDEVCDASSTDRGGGGRASGKNGASVAPGT